jgi:hypothetical protein
MVRVLGMAAATALLIFSGLLHGWWTGRWAAPEQAMAAAARLERVPLTLGDWDGEDLPLGDREKNAAGGDAYLMRRYRNRRTGTTLSVFVVCGRPGPVSVHTPDVCYEGTGFRRLGAIARHQVRPELLPRPAEFFLATFRQEEAPVQEYLRIFWSWSGGQGWEVSDEPRLTFAAYPALYKLYIARPMAQPDEPVGQDPGVDFLKLLLPRMEKELWPRP